MSDYFYNAIKRDIVMIKNDTLSFAFEIQGLNNQIPDNIVFTCKNTPEDNTELFSVSQSDHIIERSYDPATDIRTYTLRIPPNLTENIDLGRYFYDIQINVNNDIITLMKGRLTIDYQVTFGATTTEPVYEGGDDIAYPQDNISERETRIYHALPISNIAAHINDINSQDNTYTTAQMSDALIAIKSNITDIVDSINAIRGGSSEIDLADIAGVITAQLGLLYEDGTEVLY